MGWSVELEGEEGKDCLWFHSEAERERKLIKKKLFIAGSATPCKKKGLEVNWDDDKG